MTFIHITKEKLTALETFTSIEEMDQAIREYKVAGSLSKTEKDVLFTLSQYSVKYVGVSYLRKNNRSQQLANRAGRLSVRAIVSKHLAS